MSRFDRRHRTRCLEPTAKEFWDAGRVVERVEASAWARGVLTGPRPMHETIRAATAQRLPRGRVLVDELLREKDVQPIRSPEDPAGADVFESADELHEFLELTHAARRDELA